MNVNEANESEWSKENLMKLLAALKTNSGQHDKIPYSKALRKVDWQNVAFPPFSAEACQRKWTEVLQTMQKTRTLRELIVDAEDTLTNPTQTLKRPSPANVIFFEENWAEFRRQNPNMKSQKLLILISNKYKELPDEEKARYVEKHQRASEEYKRQMVTLGKRRAASNGPKAKLSRRSIATNTHTTKGDEEHEHDEGLPAKPPLSGYSLFCKQQLNSMAGVAKSSYVSVWAQRWRDLSEEQRKDYSARCEELKSEYMSRLNEHIMTLSEEEQQRVLEEHGIKSPTPKKKGKLKFFGEPKMPARSGNTIFFKDQMKALKEEIPNSRKRFVEVSHRWSNLSTQEKLLYSEKLHESMKTYSVELQNWFQMLTPATQQKYLDCNPKKCKYLDLKQCVVENIKEEPHFFRTSDSEDEILGEISSDEKEDSFVFEEDDSEEEDGDDTMFDMF